MEKHDKMDYPLETFEIVISLRFSDHRNSTSALSPSL